MLFYKFEYENVKTSQKEMPNLIFENATMYKINEKEVASIVKAKKAMNYKSGKVIMHNGTLYSKSKDNKTNSLVRADLIVEENDIVKFKSNVIYSRDDDLFFTTDELKYDKITKIASNNVKFEAKQKNNIFRGDTILINQNNNKIKAKNVEFLYAK